MRVSSQAVKHPQLFSNEKQIEFTLSVFSSASTCMFVRTENSVRGNVLGKRGHFDLTCLKVSLRVKTWFKG